MKRSGTATVGAILISAASSNIAQAYEFNITISDLSINFASKVSGEEPKIDEPENPAEFHRMRCVEPNDGQHIGGLENKKLVAEHAGFKEIARNGEKKWYRVFMQCLVIAGKRADAGWYNEITVAFLVRARWCAMPCSGDNDFSRKPPSNFVHNDNGYGSWSPWREFMRRAWVTCEQTSGVIASGPLQEATQDTSNVDGSTVITSLDTGGGRITCKGKFTIHGLSSDEENVFNEFQSKKFPE